MENRNKTFQLLYCVFSFPQINIWMARIIFIFPFNSCSMLRFWQPYEECSNDMEKRSINGYARKTGTLIRGTFERHINNDARSVQNALLKILHNEISLLQFANDNKMKFFSYQIAWMKKLVILMLIVNSSFAVSNYWQESHCFEINLHSNV